MMRYTIILNSYKLTHHSMGCSHFKHSYASGTQGAVGSLGYARPTHGELHVGTFDRTRAGW